MEKNILYKLLLAAIVIFCFVACSDDDSDNVGGNSNFNPAEGFYVMNQGLYGSNTASLVFFDLMKNRTVDAFKYRNGIDLGDTAQDMILYGDKIYISVYNSGVIYVTNKNATILKVIKDDNNKLQPRSLTAGDGKVYVSLYDGYLARIDTTTMVIDKKIAVGPNPEGVKVVNDKVYVANSGGLNYMNGYNNTLSIVDLDFSSKKDIEVGVNPNQLELDEYGNLYLVSNGDYGISVSSKLQQINVSDESVTVLKEGNIYSIHPSGNKLYVLSKVYGQDGLPSSVFYYYDILKKEFVDQSFITDGTIISDITSMSENPVSGEYLVTAANGYENNGDVYIFSSAGKLKSKFDSGSANPVKLLFMNK